MPSGLPFVSVWSRPRGDRSRSVVALSVSHGPAPGLRVVRRHRPGSGGWALALGARLFRLQRLYLRKPDRPDEHAPVERGHQTPDLPGDLAQPGLALPLGGAMRVVVPASKWAE